MPEELNKTDTLGRSAIMIHGIAILFALAAMVLAYFSRKSATDENLVRATIMGFLTWLVLAGWSLVLAIRSMLKNENPAWASAVLAVAFMELVVLLGAI